MIRFFEYIWLLTSFIALLAFIHSTQNSSAKDSIVFLIIFIVALLMSFLRRKIRKSRKE